MTMQEFVQLVCDRYRDDPSSPSVLVSWLGEEHELRWYASVVRYAARYGQDKFVVCSARGESLENVLHTLATEYSNANG